MATEIERKYLLKRLPPELEAAAATPMVQGYLRADEGGTVRLRITGAGAVLNVKGPSQGRRRLEFEYPVPAEDARAMLEALAVGHPVEKIRYCLPFRGFLWEVDVFSGANAGLVLAEVELEDENVVPPLPAWVGREVTGELRYYNAYLTRHPFADWPAADREGA